MKLTALLWILFSTAALSCSGRTRAEQLPIHALEHLPALVQAQVRIWPEAPIPSFIAGQIEQESCISFSHSKCWNPRAELKTSREYGFGFGQITRAYAADGSVRFDKFSELQQRYASLRGWTWENRFDPAYQLTALIELDRGIFRRVAGSASDSERVAFTLAAYNGGESGVRQDQLLCKNTEGCDQARWFAHVERTSLKSRRPNPGYRLSSFQINRAYVRSVLCVRRFKYEPYFRGSR